MSKPDVTIDCYNVELGTREASVAEAKRWFSEATGLPLRAEYTVRYCVRPRTRRARRWFSENVASDDERPGGTYIVDPSLIETWIEAMRGAGLNVSVNE